MAQPNALNNHQFKARLRKDPIHDTRKPSFKGSDGSKTMRVDTGKGLPRPQERHRHHRHNAPRTRRAR